MPLPYQNATSGKGFAASNATETYRIARRLGWKLSRDKKKCWCPDCKNTVKK